MPCRSDYMEPSPREEESKKVIEYLKEFGIVVEGDYYGNVRDLDEHTAMLCEQCKNNDVTKKSLELQIWWRDHKMADTVRELEERYEEKREADKKAALAKLTPYEREILELD